MSSQQDTIDTTVECRDKRPFVMLPFDRPTTANSQRSGAASVSTTGIQSALAQATADGWRRRVASEAKLFLLIVPPLIVVISLCALSLKAANAAIRMQDTLQANVVNSENIGLLATALQKERGKTCLYVSTAANNSSTLNTTAYVDMLEARQMTDAVLQRIDLWLGTESDGPEFANKSIFVQSVLNFRATVTSGNASCDTILLFYTAINKKLIAMLTRPFRDTPDGSFWSLIEAYHLLLLAKDYFGLQRALGAAYFADGSFESTQSFAEFSNVVGASEVLLSTALYLSPEAQVLYEQKMLANKSLMMQLEQTRNEITESNAKNQSVQDTRGSIWFDNMTTYLSILGEVDAYVSNVILSRLNTTTAARKLEYYLIIGCVVAVFSICPPITIWYAVKSRKLVNRIETFIRKLSSQTKVLTMEKQRTDLLLYQLLPKAIATELKQNKVVCPEHFEEATVLFSDIQGFTTMSSKSTPMQIVEFLNQLYTQCDHILDQYDVYKVETIGDAYMVVSGVPTRNKKNHSAEAASVALHILMAMEEFRIPHMQTERLLMRIGIHTGPVAAGVVGNKMPRYCLFGDTVTTASAMESTSLALRVHLSPWTNNHLHMWHPDVFETLARGSVDLKFRGSVTTYWLLGKKYFPFRIDLEHADDVVSRTTYWRR